ncbi:MAG: Phosphocholine transferase AnkX [Candidatus Anoxychlamydiales bacterium]|nr:Phosphocholine transferase AnkX [Candidatus Anoxychlamydiales bacterium]
MSNLVSMNNLTSRPPQNLTDLDESSVSRVRSYEESILKGNLSFTDDEHENFIKENSDDLKQLAQSLITKAFFTAIKKGHIKTLKVFQQKIDIDINVLDESEKTPLMMAIWGDHKEIVDYLIQQKAKINQIDRWGGTALTAAIFRDQIEIVSILCDNGANKDVQDRDGETALMIAAARDCKEIVSILCNNGAERDIQNRDGKTALMIATRRGHKEIVSILCDNGANKDVQDRDGETALMIAARSCYNEIISILLEKGADSQVQNKNGQTLLSLLSIRKETIEIVDLLVRKKGIKITYDITRIETIAKYANKLIKELSKLDKKEEEKTRSHASNALVLLPLEDHNAAFNIHKILSTITTLEKSYNVKIKHPTSAEKIKRLFEKRKYDLLFILGHGSPEGIRFTDAYCLTEKDVQILESFQRPLLDARIVLFSCETGFFGGIADLIAKTARAKTFAAYAPCNDFKMELSNEFKFKFFNDLNHDVTRVIDPFAEKESEVAVFLPQNLDSED